MKEQNTPLAKIGVMLMCLLLITNVYGQHWRTTGNGPTPAVDAPTATSYVGTNIAVPFNLKTTLVQPMNFFTANTQRMTISGTTGFVGIGDSFLSPLTLLHLNGFGTNSTGNVFRTDGDQSIVNQWQLFTGTNSTTTTQKFRLFVSANLSDVGLHSTEDLFLGTGAIFAERLRIHDPSGNVAIGTSSVPLFIRMNILAQAQPQSGGTNPNLFDIVVQGRVNDDTLSNIRLMNGTNADLEFVPQVAGYNNSTLTGLLSHKQGLILSGAIRSAADAMIIGAPTPAVVEFDARKRNANGTGSAAITARNLFQWCNFNILEMLMDASGQLGINTVSPNNRLHITTRAGDPYFGSPNGSSGLRFTNMTNTSTPVVNTGNMGVLSVDSNGDVIYVTSNSNPGVGNYCGVTPTNPLINNYEVPLNNFDYFFSGQNQPTDNRVAIGANCTTPLLAAKLNVLEQSISPVSLPITFGGLL